LGSFYKTLSRDRLPPRDTELVGTALTSLSYGHWTVQVSHMPEYVDSLAEPNTGTAPILIHELDAGFLKRPPYRTVVWPGQRGLLFAELGAANCGDADS
jgi:hypothetical protein